MHRSGGALCAGRARMSSNSSHQVRYQHSHSSGFRGEYWGGEFLTTYRWRLLKPVYNFWKALTSLHMLPKSIYCKTLAMETSSMSNRVTSTSILPASLREYQVLWQSRNSIFDKQTFALFVSIKALGREYSHRCISFDVQWRNDGILP